MLIEECLHCHRKVVLSSSGSCPACGGRASDLAGVDASLSELAMDDVHPLPAICVLCGRDTSRKVRIRRSRNDPNESFLTLGHRTGLSLIGVWIASRIFKLGKQMIAFQVPVCKPCQGEGKKVEIRHVDFEQRRAILLVTVAFKDRVANK